MKKITIYEYQLKEILDTLELTSRIHDCNKRGSCWARKVIMSRTYSENALLGNIDSRVRTH